MTLPEPVKSKRKFWQLHLSTAVVLMLVASVIVGALTKYANAPIHVYDSADKSAIGQARVEIAAEILILSIIAIPLLFLIAFVSEYLIRHREGRKP